MRKTERQVDCPHCGHTVESLHHKFWDYRHVIQLWRHIIRIFERKGTSLFKDIEGYDSSPLSYTPLIKNDSSFMIPHQRDIWGEPSEKVYSLWELLSSSTLWVLWKSENVEERKTSLVEAIQ